jgi:hypothetical protein
MIDDHSRTLRAILTRKDLPPELAGAQIVFDHPSETFNPQQTTVDLFLYDIREDLELRSNEEVIEHLDGRVITHRPPMRVACSYLDHCLASRRNRCGVAGTAASESSTPSFCRTLYDS